MHDYRGYSPAFKKYIYGEAYHKTDFGVQLYLSRSKTWHEIYPYTLNKRFPDTILQGNPLYEEDILRHKNGEFFLVLPCVYEYSPRSIYLRSLFCKKKTQSMFQAHSSFVIDCTIIGTLIEYKIPRTLNDLQYVS
jgi:hypothetical protein